MKRKRKRMRVSRRRKDDTEPDKKTSANAPTPNTPARTPPKKRGKIGKERKERKRERQRGQGDGWITDVGAGSTQEGGENAHGAAVLVPHHTMTLGRQEGTQPRVTEHRLWLLAQMLFGRKRTRAPANEPQKAFVFVFVSWLVYSGHLHTHNLNIIA